MGTAGGAPDSAWLSVLFARSFAPSWNPELSPPPPPPRRMASSATPTRSGWGLQEDRGRSWPSWSLTQARGAGGVGPVVMSRVGNPCSGTAPEAAEGPCCPDGPIDARRSRSSPTPRPSPSPASSVQGEPWVPGKAVGKAPRRPFSGLRVSRGGVLVTPGLGRGPWTKPRMT